MFSTLTNAGRAAIADTYNSTDRIKFTRFEIGLKTGLPDLNDVDYDYEQEVSTTGFVPFYEGDASRIYYHKASASRLLLKCYTPPDTVFFRFNTILLYAEMDDGEEFVFSVHWYTAVNPKFDIEISQGGMKHYFILLFNVKKQDQKFDFSNLVLQTVVFESYDDYYTDVPTAAESDEDQIMINTHINDLNEPGKIFAISTEGQWYGMFSVPVQFNGTDYDQILPAPVSQQESSSSFPYPIFF